jgi:EipB-like
MRGQLFYDLSGSVCLGSKLSTRINTETTSKTGGKTASDVHSESWADYNGAQFKFSFSRYDGDKLSESIKGSARRNEGAVLAELDAPKKMLLLCRGMSCSRYRTALQSSKPRRRVSLAWRPRSMTGVTYDTTTVIGPSLKKGRERQAQIREELGNVIWPSVVVCRGKLLQ